MVYILVYMDANKTSLKQAERRGRMAYKALIIKHLAIRRLLLYPAELRNQAGAKIAIFF